MAEETKNTLKELLRLGCFKHYDYKYDAEFALLYLGVRVYPGAQYTFPDLDKVNNARFTQKGLFFAMMELLMDLPSVSEQYSEVEKKHINDVALFSIVYYIPYFLQSPIASKFAFIVM